jgi:NitT/TauT family transport system substrate-binding protein
VRITYSSDSPAFLTHFVAEALGYYREQSVESESMLANPTVSLPGLVAGEFDYVLSIGSLIRAASRGLPVRVLAVDVHKPNFFLVTRPSVQQGSDLRGKMLGVGSFGGTTHQTAKLYAAHFGLDPEHDVQYLSLGDESLILETMRLGRVDAAPLSPPLPAIAQSEGLRVLASPDQLTAEYPFIGVGTSVQKIASQRDAVSQMLKGYVTALQAVRTRREAVVQLMINRWNLAPDVAAVTYEQLLPTWTGEAAARREGIETLLRFDIEAGTLDAMVPYEQIVDSSVLEQAQREVRR